MEGSPHSAQRDLFLIRSQQFPVWTLFDKRNRSSTRNSTVRHALSTMKFTIKLHFAVGRKRKFAIILGKSYYSRTSEAVLFVARIQLFLTFIGPCIANIFADYNHWDATFHNLFISERRSTCFRRGFRPSSRAQNCTYSIRYFSDQYCYLLLALQG